MLHRTPAALLLALVCCATCFGQTVYRGLTPGRSTRAEVERVLGQPLKVIQELLVEYKSPDEGTKLYAQYVDASAAAVVDRIELTCQNKSCVGTDHERFKHSVRDVEFDVRVTEPRRGDPPSDTSVATVYFGAPRFLTFVEIWRPGNVFEYRAALMSPELYKGAVPKGGCTGSIFGTWEMESRSSFGNSRLSRVTKDPDDFNPGRVIVERAGDGGIKGTYQINNGTLTLRRAWEGDQNFVYGYSKHKGEWRDDTGSGTVEIEVEGFNDFHTASAKFTRASGSSQDSNARTRVGSSVGAIIGAIAPNWSGKCVP